jgi:hypothetical protein
MTEINSELKPVPHSADSVYEVLSDLSHVSKAQQRLAHASFSLLDYDMDFCRFKVEKAGTISLRIVNRVPGRQIDFKSEESPLSFLCSILLKESPVGQDHCLLQLTVKADIPFMLKGMVIKPLEDLVQKSADLLATLPYQTLLSSNLKDF